MKHSDKFVNFVGNLSNFCAEHGVVLSSASPLVVSNFKFPIDNTLQLEIADETLQRVKLKVNGTTTLTKMGSALRIEWRVGDTAGNGMWFPEAARELLQAWVDAACKEYGAQSHWIRERTS